MLHWELGVGRRYSCSTSSSSSSSKIKYYSIMCGGLSELHVGNTSNHDFLTWNVAVMVRMYVGRAPDGWLLLVRSTY